MSPLPPEQSGHVWYLGKAGAILQRILRQFWRGQLAKRRDMKTTFRRPYQIAFNATTRMIDSVAL